MIAAFDGNSLNRSGRWMLALSVVRRWSFGCSDNGLPSVAASCGIFGLSRANPRERSRRRTLALTLLWRVVADGSSSYMYSGVLSINNHRQSTSHCYHEQRNHTCA
jgi:hypothetical protein